MLARLLRLLAPLTPRRRPRLFPILRRGRFQTGLFRSRRPHPTPSPRPRPQRPWRHPAVPSQPQPSSPTRQKIRPKLSLASPNPLWGFGLARDSSPFTPTQFPPPGTRPQPRPIPATAGCPARPHGPASRPALATPPWQDLAHPCHTPVRSVAGRGPARPRFTRRTPRRTSRVFWKKLLRAQPRPVSRSAPAVRLQSWATPAPQAPRVESIGQAIAIVLALLAAFGAAVWAAAFVWAWQDIRRRTQDIYVRLFAPLLVLVLGPLGALLYMLLRPAETLDEAHLRQLQEETLLQDMEAASPGPQLHPANGVVPTIGRNVFLAPGRPVDWRRAHRGRRQRLVQHRHPRRPGARAHRPGHEHPGRLRAARGRRPPAGHRRRRDRRPHGHDPCLHDRGRMPGRHPVHNPQRRAHSTALDRGRRRPGRRGQGVLGTPSPVGRPRPRRACDLRRRDPHPDRGRAREYRRSAARALRAAGGG